MAHAKQKLTKELYADALPCIQLGLELHVFFVTNTKDTLLDFMAKLTCVVWGKYVVCF